MDGVVIFKGEDYFGFFIDGFIGQILVVVVGCCGEENRGDVVVFMVFFFDEVVLVRVVLCFDRVVDYCYFVGLKCLYVVSVGYFIVVFCVFFYVLMLI